MKNISPWHIVACLFISLSVCGCSGSNSGEKRPTPEKEKTLKYDSRGATHNMWPGDVREVSIVTEGDFEIQPLNNETAEVEVVSDKTFRVKAKAKGRTDLSILDINEEGKIYYFTIFVKDQLTGPWVDASSLFKYVIDVSDADTKEAINSDLGAKLSLFLGTIYNFKDAQKTFTTSAPGNLSGTYEFDIYSKTLVLEYDGCRDVFAVETDPATDRNLALTLDLTDHYQSLYPDKGVTKVESTRWIYLKNSEFEK